MEARFHDCGTAPARLEAPFRVRIDATPFPSPETASAPGWGGIPLHTDAERWYDRCQQIRPNGETNTHNPERETA
jgi:hypothetical protein